MERKEITTRDKNLTEVHKLISEEKNLGLMTKNERKISKKNCYLLSLNDLQP